MLLMTSYLVTIATDCRQTLPTYVLRIGKQLLQTAWANNKYSWKEYAMLVCYATYDVISRYHSNRLSSNVTNICLKDR